MSENPYQPPQVECRDLRWIDHASIFFAAGITGLIAGIGAKELVVLVLVYLAPRAGISERAYLYAPDGSGIVFGLMWFLGWYCIAARKARNSTTSPDRIPSQSDKA